MPPKTTSLEIQSAPAPVEIQQEAQDILEKKKLEEQAKVDLDEQQSVETAHHDEDYDSEIEALQKKIETENI